MQPEAFFRVVTMDRSSFEDRVLALLEREKIRFCVIGGQGVNAYVEPLVSLDLDIAVAADQIARLKEIVGREFGMEQFPHSLNISDPGSALRIQFQTDPRYSEFVAGAQTRSVLGRMMPVARVEDVFRGKTWAALDPARRPSKRQKDLADIARLIETFPSLRDQTPPRILDRLEKP
jgi:hypothetical protein